MNINRQKILQFAGIAVLAGIIFAASFSSCEKSGAKTNAFSAVKSTSAPRLMMNSAKQDSAVTYDADDMAFEEEAVYDMADSGVIENGSSAVREKKIIKNGNVSLEVESLAETMAAVEKWVKDFGGYISWTNENNTNMGVTAQIPSEKFDDAMNAAGDFGKIISRNISTRDVSNQFYDLETRLETQKTLQEKLEGYLKDAKNINEIIQIESKLSSVTAELERMQTQMNGLSRQISYSEIYLNASLPRNQSESGFILPDTKNEFRAFIGNILSFFVKFAFGIFYIIIYGVPCALLLILLYWLCFGKVGLLRKLFEKVK